MGLLSKEVAVKNMVPVCRQLATAFDAGIPILRSLELVRENSADAKTRRVLEAIEQQVKNGESLATAARSQRGYLPDYFIELLASGELGGRLDIMLNDVADYYEDRLALRRSITRMLAYPCVVLTLAWFLGSFALIRISTIDFAGGTSLNLSECLGVYGAFQAKALAIFALLCIAVIALSRFGLLGYTWGWISHYCWPLRGLSRKLALSRFFRSLSLLIGSGLPIGRCIQYAASITANPYMEQDLLKALPPIQEGATLVQAFASSSSLPRMAREMLFIGEESGNLEEALRKVSEYFLEEVNHRMQKLARIMPSIIMLFVGVAVGFIIIRFYQGYFSILDQF